MKIFAFNPYTGRRGELLEHTGVANWTGCSLNYAVDAGQFEPIPHHEPVGFGRDADVTVHVDAGREYWKGSENISGSYQRADEWVCFCLGNFRAGTDS